MGERAVFSIMAHVFQIDQETKKKWIPSSSSPVKVAYYHDPAKKTYRIIAIEHNKALVNSTITANMNFTKTSPKFGQWSDHRASTVYGLGFSSEKDLTQFIEKFKEAKLAAQELAKERQLLAQRLQDQDKPHPPAGLSTSPTSPPVKSPSVISPPVTTSNSTFKSPSPSSVTSPGPYTSLTASGPGTHSTTSTAEGSQVTTALLSDIDKEKDKEMKSGRKENSSSREEEQITNGNQNEHVHNMSNGHNANGDSERSPDGQFDSLKAENNKLKMALASSTTNVKKWESEIQTLKKHNSRLQSALEESKLHVSQWKTQLQKYKEENDMLKKKSESVEELQKENEELKEVLNVVQLDLETKTEELKEHTTRADSAEEELDRVKENFRMIEEENQNLTGQVTTLEDQLQMASVASKMKLKDIQQRHTELGHKLRELTQLHKDIESHLDA